MHHHGAYETKHSRGLPRYTNWGNARKVECGTPSDAKNLDEDERGKKGKRDFPAVIKKA